MLNASLIYHFSLTFTDKDEKRDYLERKKGGTINWDFEGSEEGTAMRVVGQKDYDEESGFGEADAVRNNENRLASFERKNFQLHDNSKDTEKLVSADGVRQMRLQKNTNPLSNKMFQIFEPSKQRNVINDTNNNNAEVNADPKLTSSFPLTPFATTNVFASNEFINNITATINATESLNNNANSTVVPLQSVTITTVPTKDFDKEGIVLEKGAVLKMDTDYRATILGSTDLTPESSTTAIEEGKTLVNDDVTKSLMDSTKFREFEKDIKSNSSMKGNNLIESNGNKNPPMIKKASDELSRNQAFGLIGKGITWDSIKATPYIQNKNNSETMIGTTASESAAELEETTWSTTLTLTQSTTSKISKPSKSVKRGSFDFMKKEHGPQIRHKTIMV